MPANSSSEALINSVNSKYEIDRAGSAILSVCGLRDQLKEAPETSDIGTSVEMIAERLPDDLLQGTDFYNAAMLEGIAKRLIELDVHDSELALSINDIFNNLTGTEILKEKPSDCVFYELPSNANA